MHAVRAVHTFCVGEEAVHRGEQGAAGTITTMSVTITMEIMIVLNMMLRPRCGLGAACSEQQHAQHSSTAASALRRAVRCGPKCVQNVAKRCQNGGCDTQGRTGQAGRGAP